MRRAPEHGSNFTVTITEVRNRLEETIIEQCTNATLFLLISLA